MVMASFNKSLLLVLAVFVFVPETEGVPLNDPCTINSNCTESVTNSVCETGFCKCDTGYQENSESCNIVTCSASTANNANPNKTSVDFSGTVQYTCVTGYEHTSGNLTRTCQADGSLTGTAPACTVVTCSAEPRNHATPGITSIPYNNNVVYSCDTGYELTSGTLTRTCQASGSLNGTDPVCSIKTCAVPIVDHATANRVSPINYNTEVTYTCNAGYTLSGDAIRRCNSEGSLTGTEPVCNIKTCAVPIVDHATANRVSPINYNTEVTYTCNTGYTLSGYATRRCNAEGSLTGTEPVCNIKTCSVPIVDHATANRVSPINYYTEVTYTCNTGYTLSGDATRRCNADGSLTGIEPVCNIKTCAVPIVDHATANRVSPINYYTEVTYTCNTGYTLSGDATRRCNADGSLTGTEPVCNIKTCAVPIVDHATANRASPINYNTEVTYTCNTGYTLSGYATRRCNSEGSLTGTDPVCNIKTCAVQSVDHATVSQSTINYNTEVTYTCNTGYTLSGDATRRCNSDGTLTGTDPVCNIKTCSAPGLSNGTPSSQSTINYDTDVTYSCNTGYTHTGGDLTRTCNADGQLTGVPPVCTINTCAVTAVSNVISNPPSSIEYNTYVTYTCQTGYTKTSGDQTRRCQANSTLTGSPPVCTRITCAAVVVADSSKDPEENEYDFNTTVTYSCDAGFEHISGDLSRRCGAMNKWTGTVPTCGKIQLGKSGCSTVGSVNSCEDPNAVCNSQRTCECDTSFYDNNGADEFGKCTAKVLLGANGCTTAFDITDSCLETNTVCNSSLFCVCKSGYYDDNGSTGAGSCAKKAGLGGSCSSAYGINDSCSDVNAYCGQDKCICKTEYFDDNEGVAGGLCRERVAIDVVCPTEVRYTYHQCNTENAKCTQTSQSEYRCQCIAGYHSEVGTGSSKICVANKPLGGKCEANSIDQCSDPEADCLSDGAKYICTCKVGFYDDNGFSLAGNCKGVSNLMVSASTISFTNVATEGFTVSWSGPGNYIDHVSSYSVSWSPSNGQAINKGKQTTADIPGLMPGQVYDVTITSQNDVTQVSSPRIVSVTKQQSAKPNIPGPLLLDQCNFNATNDFVGFVWMASSGKVSRYLLEVYEGEDELSRRVVEPPDGNKVSASMQISNIKNGHRYNVSITAQSMFYQLSETVDSDTYTEQIKTVVMPPLKPTGFNCKQRSDEFIVLQWVEPELPNGDLIQYKILVHFDTQPISKNGTVYTNVPVTEFEVQNLEPGTYYQFWIYTENEDFLSTDYSTTRCKTLDKVSDPPNTLEISDVSSRYMIISWTKPTKSYGEILGYALQLRDSTQKCHSEVFIKCFDCIGTINDTSLQRKCPTDVSRTVMISKIELSETQRQNVSGLLPYFTYSISVAAINEKGEGKMAEDTQRTLEEAPVKPADLKVETITTTTFVVKWTKGDVRPGLTNYTVDVISTVTTDTQLDKKIILMGYDKESTKIEGLEEYWDYNVKVTATTSVASVVSDQLETIRTLPTRPGPVDGFNIITGHDEGGTYQTLIVEWKIPQLLDRNSEITGYKFMSNDTTENIDERQLTANPDEETYVYRETIDVEPENYYTIEVLAINHKNKSGQSVKQLQQAPAGVPVNIEKAEGVEVIAKDRAGNFGQTSFMIPITKRFYNQGANGRPVEGGLVACAEEKHTYQSSQSTSMTLTEYQQMDNWAKASEKGYSCYRPTKKGFIDNLTAARRKKRAVDDEIEFVLGEEDCSTDTGFCNGPLAPNTAYIVRLVVCTNGGCLVSKEYGPFHTVPIPPPPSSIGGIVGGAVGGVVAAGVVVGVILFVMHRRRRNFGKSTQKAKELTPTEIHPEIPNRRPVTLDMFPQHVARLHKDSNLLFSAEYDDLKTLSPSHPTTAADEEDNRLKNRYINILPFDQTRVKLQKKTDEDQDFINANYLPGYKSGREYIGCQGPIPATLDDIWRMVWEQNVAVIVMLTLCKEGNKVKCEQYWPDVVGEPKQYGDIVVEMTSTSNIKFYDYRIFKLTYADTTKVIKHFHFLSWLDFQANITHDTILDFISQVRSHVQPPDTAGPMIVHCSAGVGRTGTYICLDHLMQFIADHDFSAEIDIFNMVLKLRENRPHMVQTEQQYVFIHDCVNEILERKRQALMEQNNIYENQGFEDPENLYQNSEHLYQNVQIAGGKQLQKTEL